MLYAKSLSFSRILFACYEKKHVAGYFTASCLYSHMARE
jgi:hypothetical protein